MGAATRSGEQAIRFFDNCNDNGCTAREYGAALSMASRRWYPTRYEATARSL